MTQVSVVGSAYLSLPIGEVPRSQMPIGKVPRSQVPTGKVPSCFHPNLGSGEAQTNRRYLMLLLALADNAPAVPFT